MISLGRVGMLIDKAINDFELDLSGLNVLTELATGYYALTPIIAARAGAEVTVMGEDSQYGTYKEVRDALHELSIYYGVGDKIVGVDKKAKSLAFRSPNIVTNLGHVRPLVGQVLKFYSGKAVIPLMCEAWEVREEDVNVNECRAVNIPVCATNEVVLGTFEYVGMLAIRLLFELDIEVYDSDILVLGRGTFGYYIRKALERVGAHVTHLASYKPDTLRYALEGKDAVVVAEHLSRKWLIGPNGSLTAEEIKEINPGVSLAHIAGDVDVPSLRRSGISYVPHHIAPAGFMSLGTDYVGPKPLVELHTAGLKIGEVMAREMLHSKDVKRAEAKADELPFAEGV